MSTFSPHSFWEGSETELQRLERWEAEWSLQQQLRAMTPRDEVASAARSLLSNLFPGTARSISRVHPQTNSRSQATSLAAGVLSFPSPLGTPEKHRGSVLVAGQIRALPALPVLGILEPVHVFLLEASEENGGSWTVLPFGSLPVPGLEGEWQTPWSDEPEFAILQMEHGFKLAQALLQESQWCFDATAEELALVLRLVYGNADTTDWQEDLSLHQPPLAHPLDPRHDYQLQCARETAPWRHMVPCPQVLLKHKSTHSGFRLTASVAASLSNREVRYAFQMRDRLGQLELRLKDGIVEFHVIKPADLQASDLHGALLISATTWCSLFAGGRAVAPLSALRAGFVIFDNEGRVVELLPPETTA